MRLKLVQVNQEIFTPNGGGSRAYCLRDNQFELVMEGSWIRVRSKSVTNGDVYEIPMANVAVIQRIPEEPPANDNGKKGAK